MSCSARPVAEQEPEWGTVLAEVYDYEDALALSRLFEYRDDVLFANDLPVDALITGAAFLTERGFASFLADHLNALHGEAWSYLDLYGASRGRDGTPEYVDALIERCRAAGVALSHRPQPTPWRVVISQLASDADLAAFAILAGEYTANSWWIDLEVDLEMPRQVEQVATSDQIADLIARCRRAGVVLRRDP